MAENRHSSLIGPHVFVVSFNPRVKSCARCGRVRAHMLHIDPEEERQAA